MCCYFRSIFVPRNCSLIPLLYILYKFDVIICRQINNWSIKFSIIYLKCFSSCWYDCHWLNKWISIWISCYCRCYWYLWYHTFLLPWSNFISQLIYGKSRNLLKLFKYFNGTTTSVSYVLLSSGILPIIFVLYSKDLLFIVLSLFFWLTVGLFSIAESFIASQ